MNGRERLVKTLRGEPVDRVPIAPYLCYNNVYEMFDYVPALDTFCDPPDFDVSRKYVEYCDHFGFDVLHACGYVLDAWTLDKPGENWDVQVTQEGDAETRLKTLEITTPLGKLRQTENWRRSSKYMFVWAPGEQLVKTKQDFEILRRFAPPSDQIDCRVITRARAAVGDKGIVDQPIHGVFNTLSQFRKLDEVLMDPLRDEGWYREMMEFTVDWLIRQCRAMAKAGAELFDYGGNMATSSVGAKYFEKYVLPYEQRAIAAIHAAGSLVNYHNCGDAAKLLNLYNRLGIDSLGYLTPPPYGDVDLDQALKILRPDLALRGNIDQIEFMVKATPAEVRERVRNLLEKVKPRGRWILSNTDFYFDGTPYANIEAFAQAGRDFGAY